MAGGGAVPTRDSVLINAMPGEFIMRQSAVQMIGEDNLTRLNALGNRRISEMPTIASAMPKREPDHANVWIVAPETKPSLGKNDVLQIVSDDMLQNGQTRKLVKAISLGAA